MYTCIHMYVCVHINTYLRIHKRIHAHGNTQMEASVRTPSVGTRRVEGGEKPAAAPRESQRPQSRPKEPQPYIM